MPHDMTRHTSEAMFAFMRSIQLAKCDAAAAVAVAVGVANDTMILMMVMSI